MFKDRRDAGRRLAEALKGVVLVDPLVLAIPRGGIEVGDTLAQGLGADLDVVMSRKLRAPGMPELAVGAVGENGRAHLDREIIAATGAGEGYIETERRHQIEEIERRVRLFRAARPRAPIAGRSVVLTDDGIATGSTMLAAIDTVREAGPKELIVAVPVAAPDRVQGIKDRVDRFLCLELPEYFRAVGLHFADFRQVEDDRVVDILRGYAAPRPGGARPRPAPAGSA